MEFDLAAHDRVVANDSDLFDYERRNDERTQPSLLGADAVRNDPAAIDWAASDSHSNLAWRSAVDRRVGSDQRVG